MLHFPMIEILTPEGRQARAVAERIEGVRSVTVYGDRLHVGLDAAAAADAVVAAIASRGVEVTGKRPILPSLEDAFIALVTGRGKRPGEQPDAQVRRRRWKCTISAAPSAASSP